MLVNISEDFSQKRELINEEVGKPFPLEERERIAGTHLQNIPVTAASLKIYNLLMLNEGSSTCSLELRPKGIIIGFRGGSETYALVIPYYKLRVYKGRPEQYAFYKDQHFIKIMAKKDDPEIHRFIKKITHFKAGTRSSRIEDL